MKGLVFLAASLSFLVLAYLFAVPLWLEGLVAFRPRRLQTLAQARDYYSVVGTGLTALFGLAGVGLGLYYYHDKKLHESREASRDRLRSLLDELAVDLDEVQRCIDFSRLHGFSSLEGQKFLTAVLRKLENILLIVEDGSRPLRELTGQASCFIALNSYLEPIVQELLETPAADNARGREAELRDRLTLLPNYLEQAKSICLRKWV